MAYAARNARKRAQFCQTDSGDVDKDDHADAGYNDVINRQVPMSFRQFQQSSSCEAAMRHAYLFVS